MSPMACLEDVLLDTCPGPRAMMSMVNNRELAALIWVTAFVLWAFSEEERARSLCRRRQGVPQASDLAPACSDVGLGCP